MKKGQKTAENIFISGSLAVAMATAVAICDDEDSYHFGKTERDTIPLVMDVDTGRDDAWALLGAMDEFKVSAVVATYGNVPLPLTVRNSLDVVFLARKELPSPATKPAKLNVWEGEGAPLKPFSPVGIAEIQRRAGINGNGLCNLVLERSSKRPVSKGEHWEKAFIDYLKKKGPVDYVVCGPLTNLAEIIKASPLDKAGKPEILKYINRVVVMGGSFAPDLPVDFNFKADPVAAQSVISAFGKDIVLVPFDETRKLRLTEQEIESLVPQDRAAEFSKNLMLAHARGWSTDKSILLHDPSTLLIVEGSGNLVEEKISIVLEGANAGKVVYDSNGTTVLRKVIEPGMETTYRNRLLGKFLNLGLPTHSP